jgi:hypothetical protein
VIRDRQDLYLELMGRLLATNTIEAKKIAHDLRQRCSRLAWPVNWYND